MFSSTYKIDVATDAGYVKSDTTMSASMCISIDSTNPAAAAAAMSSGTRAVTDSMSINIIMLIVLWFFPSGMAFNFINLIVTEKHLLQNPPGMVTFPAAIILFVLFALAGYPLE